MKNTLEKLWEEYFSEECAILDTEEERELVSLTAEANKAVNDLLTKEQRRSVERFVELLHEMNGITLKKAFCRGCEFTASFLLEAGNLEK